MIKMKHIVSMLLALLVFTGIVLAKNDGGILLEIDGIPFSKEEFVRIYEKNNKNLFDTTSKLSPKEYLELFINFKLKVREAENLGLDTTKAFINELAGYRKDLTENYLTDISYNEKMVEEMYRRMNLEISASHILISLDKNAVGDDTIQSYNKISSIRKEIMEEGADFNEMASRYSEDPSAKNNKGKLGYFSAFQMVFPFENAAFTTPLGEISMPTKSSFGYHIVRVDDVRKAKGEIKVAHIMKAFPKNSNSAQRGEISKEIDSIYSLLQSGQDFSKLAREVSEDKRSAQNGGELPWFTSANMISDFGDAAFALKKNGDYSRPIATSFGYHIIKRIDHKPIPPFEEIKGEIKERIEKDPERTSKNQEAFVKKLKKEYQFKQNDENLKILVLENTGVLSKEIETAKSGISQNELFELNGISLTFESFGKYLADKKIHVTPGESKSEILKHYNSWVDSEITNYEDKRLEEKYPEFSYLMKEYHDGILLFNLSEKKIWNFASADTTGLENFYAEQPDKFFWKERFKGFIISCKNQEARDKVDAFFDIAVPYVEILDILNEEKELVTIEEGAWEQQANPIVDYYVWGEKKPENFNEQLVYIRGDKIMPEAKLLNESRGLYISDYQGFLEQKWIEELRDKYKIKVYKKVLRTIKKI